MSHLRRIIVRASSAILPAGAVVLTGGLSEAVSADRPLAPSVQATIRDNFACGQGPGGLKMSMQSNREMAQACAKAGEVANAYTGAPQQASAERAVSVNVDGANWACVHKTESQEAYVECSHADEMLSLSKFQPVS
ncbi:hypothetical protein [Nonomuraea diastatica]|uniref:Uncharacterized protein n=1 Tax=Nonomuraea diastatica TaxID=1848329 RepID=A0A4R4WPH2_9ACTN|nr:hypothetical protein [Nonomuraea diastatica]TDD18943.1 hypothetical protein E1294_22760 [Nonomuraea diastatica]